MRETVQYKLNLPLDLKRWIVAKAAKNLRSQNAEIVLAIREKMEKENGDGGRGNAQSTT